MMQLKKSIQIHSEITEEKVRGNTEKPQFANCIIPPSCEYMFFVNNNIFFVNKDIACSSSAILLGYKENHHFLFSLNKNIRSRWQGSTFSSTRKMMPMSLFGGMANVQDDVLAGALDMDQENIGSDCHSTMSFAG